MLGDLSSQFDHVMFLLPPSTDFAGAAAYSYVNSWRSVFADGYWWMVMVQVHEIGHNLNLAHSGEGTNAYGDWTGKLLLFVPDGIKQKFWSYKFLSFLPFES